MCYDLSKYDYPNGAYWVDKMKKFDNPYRNFTENGSFGVQIDLPGYKKDEVTIELDTDTLTVTAKNENRGEKVYQVYVSEYVDTDKITSTLETAFLLLRRRFMTSVNREKLR